MDVRSAAIIRIGPIGSSAKAAVRHPAELRRDIAHPISSAATGAATDPAGGSHGSADSRVIHPRNPTWNRIVTTLNQRIAAIPRSRKRRAASGVRCTNPTAAAPITFGIANANHPAAPKSWMR